MNDYIQRPICALDLIVVIYEIELAAHIGEQFQVFDISTK